MSQAGGTMPGMCMICDGATRDEVQAETDERIDRFGFTMVGTTPDPDHPSWLHTIGLIERHNHPEMCVLGEPADDGFRLLDTVSRAVLGGTRFSEGQTLEIAGTYWHVSDLDERVVGGEMMVQWRDHYHWMGSDGLRLSALELVRCGTTPR
jgi:hypothetical protein